MNKNEEMDQLKNQLSDHTNTDINEEKKKSSLDGLKSYFEDTVQCEPESLINGTEVSQTKQMRVSLDFELQKLKSMRFSVQRQQSILKLQEAIMWLGMDLKERGTENPYPDSYKPENNIVNPTADNLKL